MRFGDRSALRAQFAARCTQVHRSDLTGSSRSSLICVAKMPGKRAYGRTAASQVKAGMFLCDRIAGPWGLCWPTLLEVRED